MARHNFLLEYFQKLLLQLQLQMSVRAGGLLFFFQLLPVEVAIADHLPPPLHVLLHFTFLCSSCLTASHVQTISNWPLWLIKDVAIHKQKKCSKKISKEGQHCKQYSRYINVYDATRGVGVCA